MKNFQGAFVFKTFDMDAVDFRDLHLEAKARRSRKPFAGQRSMILTCDYLDLF